MAKKVFRSFTKMSDDLLEHPKTKVTAKDLRIAPVHLVGHLYALWSGTKKFADDGDLSRFDDDMIAFLAEYGGDSSKFVRSLQARGWLNEKLIHDWIEHQRDWLISKYKNRPHILVEIWRKHGLEYGRGDMDGEDGGESPAASPPEPGSNREVVGKSSGSGREVNQPPQEVELEVELEALNPQALSEKEIKSPKGVFGENVDPPPAPYVSKGFSHPVFQRAFRVQGSEPPPPPDVSPESIGAEDVFQAFKTPLAFHGIRSCHELASRAKHCRVTPATWLMLFLDKLHVAYREREGGTLIDTEQADPVAMTISGFAPSDGRTRHNPTNAARSFFREVIAAFGDYAAGRGDSKWNGNLSGPRVALELERRKGRRRK